jgi:uncharacterized protein with HEPN domain
MLRDWTFFLEDIQESCSRVLRYTQGMTFEQFKADNKTYDAVVRNLEIIGEAAKGLPDDVRAMMPDIEWSKPLDYVTARHTPILTLTTRF